MNWEEFTELQITYKKELANMNHEKALELNREVYDIIFQIYLKVPQEKKEHKEHLRFRLAVLKATAITLELILSGETKQNNKEKSRETNRQIVRKINFCTQELINAKINKNGTYYDYMQSLIDEDYTEALRLSKELYQRLSKICSESEEPIKKQAILRLELLARDAKYIQPKLNQL